MMLVYLQWSKFGFKKWSCFAYNEASGALENDDFLPTTKDDLF